MPPHGVAWTATNPEGMTAQMLPVAIFKYDEHDDVHGVQERAWRQGRRVSVIAMGGEVVSGILNLSFLS